MEVIKLNDFDLDILDGQMVKITSCGNIVEIMAYDHKSTGGSITKLSKKLYVDNRTGEVKEFEHTTTRQNDLHNVAKSLKQGRDIINANCSEPDCLRWVTLTYKENVRDTKKVFFDFKNFNKRLRSRVGNYEYIACLEPQQRGAWHLHCILIFEGKAPYIPKDELYSCWQQGFVQINQVTNVDNLGAYLSAYLTDLDLSDNVLQGDISCFDVIERTLVDKDGKTRSKRFIKGGRLNLYPSGTHIFRWSKGIRKPVVEYMTYSKAKEKVSSAKLTYKNVVLLSDKEDDRDYENTLVYEYYNFVRQ